MITDIYSIGTQYWKKSYWGQGYWHNTYWKLIIVPYPHTCRLLAIDIENRILYI